MKTPLADVSNRVLKRFEPSESFMVQKSILGAVQFLLQSERRLGGENVVYHEIREPVCECPGDCHKLLLLLYYYYCSLCILPISTN